MVIKAEQFREIYDIFKKYKEIFPHIRQDYLKRMIAADNVIYKDGVVIIFQKYKKATRLGDVTVKAGTYILHQIVNANQGNGKTKAVWEEFLNKVVEDPDSQGIVLTVRSNNLRACKLYENLGFNRAGNIDWKSGEIKGSVYTLNIIHKIEVNSKARTLKANMIETKQLIGR